MKNPINIALAADAAYLVHARVMLCSLFNSNRNNDFTIYLFTESPIHPEIKKIDKLVKKFNNTLEVLSIDRKLFENFFISGHISVATYYRLLIPDMLPPEVKKVLYLDTDIVVKKDIRELWETDLKGNCIGAVDEKNKPHVERLNLPVNDAYFNAGVMLIDILLWKKLDIAKKGLQLAAKYHDKLVAFDQDILNILLVNQWYSLPQKWNQTEGHPLGRLLETPTVIHYLGAKPWTIHCIHPYKNEYYRYYYQMEGFNRKIVDMYQHYIKALKRRMSLLKKNGV